MSHGSAGGIIALHNAGITAVASMAAVAASAAIVWRSVPSESMRTTVAAAHTTKHKQLH